MCHVRKILNPSFDKQSNRPGNFSSSPQFLLGKQNHGDYQHRSHDLRAFRKSSLVEQELDCFQTTSTTTNTSALSSLSSSIYEDPND
eukprot:Awhi_evm1s1133